MQFCYVLFTIFEKFWVNWRKIGVVLGAGDVEDYMKEFQTILETKLF